MSDHHSATQPALPREIADTRVRLVFDASYEISSLSAVVRRLIDEQGIDEIGRACCGMLIRIEQLSEAISFCVDEDPVKNWGMADADLQKVVLGLGAHASRA